MLRKFKSIVVRFFALDVPGRTGRMNRTHQATGKDAGNLRLAFRRRHGFRLGVRDHGDSSALLNGPRDDRGDITGSLYAIAAQRVGRCWCIALGTASADGAEVAFLAAEALFPAHASSTRSKPERQDSQRNLLDRM